MEKYDQNSGLVSYTFIGLDSFVRSIKDRLKSYD